MDRTVQDKLAVASNERALRGTSPTDASLTLQPGPPHGSGLDLTCIAIKNKLFTEIIPMEAKVLDKDGNEKTVTVTTGNTPCGARRRAQHVASA